MARYRLTIDIVTNEDNGASGLSAADINEIRDQIITAAKIGIPPEKARKIKIDPSVQLWHAHRGDHVGCTDCAPNDGKGQDASLLFEAVEI